MKRIAAWLSALALSAGLSTGAFAEITGSAKLDGKPPVRKEVAGMSANPQCKPLHKEPVLEETVVADENGNLANVVVYLEGDNAKGEAPKDPVVIDQKGCQYVPHVVAVAVGQKLMAENSDSFMHNVHTFPENSPQKNIAQVMKGQKDEVPAKAPEAFKIKCDVHPWMNAWVVVLDTPYSAVTDEDGKFEIKTEGLKNGDYTIVAWHEKFQKSEPQKITVKDGKTDKPVTFTFKAKAAAAPAAGDVKPVALSGKADEAYCVDCAKDAKPAAAVAAK